VTLTPSDHNGFAVSCFGGRDGAITTSVSGGTAPYTYSWLHGPQEPNVGGLGAGYYRVTVMDADSVRSDADITLTEPTPIKVQLLPADYPNGYNISCTDCFNGSIVVQVTEGVPPYTYLWQDGNTSNYRTGLGHKTNYTVEVTDDNGCVDVAGPVRLTQPDRDDWTMGGNTGTDPELHYLGTNDGADLVLKSNGQERLRLGGDGTIKLQGTDLRGGVLFLEEDGTLQSVERDWEPEPIECRGDLTYHPFWKTVGNAFEHVCPEYTPALGTLGNRPWVMITDGEERMRITADGRLAIGSTSAPETKVHVEGDLLVRGGTYGDLITRSSAEEGATLWARNNYAAWGLSIAPEGTGHILGNWNNPTPHVTFTGDRIEMPTRLVIGDVEPRNGYRLMVQEGILAERVKVALKTSSEWSDHVFAPNYRLMPLPEVKAFIAEHGHLPGVPSAKQMVEHGLDVVRTHAMLLEKVEELMLYIFELEGRVYDLEAKRTDSTLD
jgi:hypothetical protein